MASSRLSPPIVFAILILCNVIRDVTAAPKGDRNKHWVDTWTSMPQLTEPHNLPPEPFLQPNSHVFKDSTLRQTLHMSIGGPKIRLRLSNVFGKTDLPITEVTVALPRNGTAGVSGIQPRTLRKVTFSGKSSFAVPSGAIIVSDPIDLEVKPQSMVSVSTYFKDGQTGNDVTGHPGSRTTSWMAFGNHASAANLEDPSAASTDHWYYVSAVETWAPTSSKAFAIIGDSITDGRGSEHNKNNRWPDMVLASMQKSKRTSGIAVVNQAAGGNRVLNDGLGPNALGRIDRDVIAQSGIGYVMIFEGVNDIGTAGTSEAEQKEIGDRLIDAYKQIISLVRTHGIPVFGGTLAPFGRKGRKAENNYDDPQREATRQRINHWIRTSGKFDAVIDVDRILRDPTYQQQLNPKYDSGDQLHPNVAGYAAVGKEFPLNVFRDYDVDNYN